jgi:Uma2 family endonuclease
MMLTEFLQWDDGSDRRFELVAGLPIEGLLATEANGELTVALAAEISGRLCPPFRLISRANVVADHRADTCYIADLAVTCAPREPGRQMVPEAVLIVELLADGQVDLRRKLADYRTLASLQEILVLFGNERRADATADRQRLAGRGSDRTGYA